MQKTNEMRDRLIKDFTENYIGKLFYFCLKKTGSNVEAEDLTQDISLHIITALNKGTIPTSFSAWVWQIARNRYSNWAKEKHNRNESVTGYDIGDYELEDQDANVLGEVLHTEQIALLRRELAFIKSDYRNIVVAYYIENKTVREIASSLSLSVNTVKSRLLRAREILKEGMDMTREFGKRSYNPENIGFVSSGDQSNGLPWKAVNRKIPHNILLQASNNPSTVEELSIELGVALPYMEEEVEMLHQATLLDKQGDKYITNFFILDKDCQIEIYNVLRQGANERSRLISEFMDDSIADIRKLGIAGDHIDDNIIRWWLVPHLIDRLIEISVKSKSNVYEPPVRANGETWGFVGYEIFEYPEELGMGQNGAGNSDNMFWVYGGFPPKQNVALLLCDCIRNNRIVASFSDIEKKVWENIEGKYAHISENGEIIPDILVLTGDRFAKIDQLFQEHRNYNKLMENMNGAYDKVEAVFKKYSHKVLHDNLGYNIRMEFYLMRMMSVNDLFADGVLKAPDNPENTTALMYVVLG
ncbi:MAG: sigma-70 family RNA polymerase sigma factor [Ruminococcaceae bacterium]|nr:sigma-70 family RNA polymerase sigma factor [Oscillospiraceae bacterium]